MRHKLYKAKTKIMSKEEFIKENRKQNLATTVMLVGLLLFMIAAFGINYDGEGNESAIGSENLTISMNIQ